MWIIWLLLGILGWLFLGFFGFVMTVKIDGYTKVDKDVRDTFGICLSLGVIAFAVALWFLIANVYSDKFLSWLLKVVNGEEENE